MSNAAVQYRTPGDAILDMLKTGYTVRVEAQESTIVDTGYVATHPTHWLDGRHVLRRVETHYEWKEQ